MATDAATAFSASPLSAVLSAALSVIQLVVQAALLSIPTASQEAPTIKGGANRQISGGQTTGVTANEHHRTHGFAASTGGPAVTHNAPSWAGPGPFSGGPCGNLKGQMILF